MPGRKRPTVPGLWQSGVLMATPPLPAPQQLVQQQARGAACDECRHQRGCGSAERRADGEMGTHR